MNVSLSEINVFRNLLYGYYEKNYRSMPWREDTSPYNVFLSELMLQQTQVNRVMQKFNEFSSVFANFEAIAKASLHEVLLLWNGLGYNRRAKYLKSASEIIVNNYKGVLPQSFDDLKQLPGIGEATARAILVYAYNKPELFIETNIRQVLIFHFFSMEEKIEDQKLLQVLHQVVDKENPKMFYWAMMDYGTFLKKQFGNLNSLSTTYTKQSKFVGSQRQKRGQILRLVLHKPQTFEMLNSELKTSANELNEIVHQLEKEKLLIFQNEMYYIG
ncbi:MAG: A/G-specific adenine glycosylase [Bacteroidales bacterium]|nr:A/G-specific adenine glycosylase [Bacteroidales bacterium]